LVVARQKTARARQWFYLQMWLPVWTVALTAAICFSDWPEPFGLVMIEEEIRSNEKRSGIAVVAPREEQQTANRARLGL
jgi:hypothetical protein